MTKNFQRLLTFFFTTVLVSVLSLNLISFQIRAQTDSSDSTATPSAQPDSLEPNLVFESSDLSDQIADLRRSYRGELETYRLHERQFNIAKEQYLKLQTLISLEEAVKGTRQAMVSRAQVLQTYLGLVRLTLISTTGVNIEEKQASLTQVEIVIKELTTHQSQLEQTDDRLSLAAMVTDFDDLGLLIDQTSHQALSLIALGKIQTVYDKSIILSQDMENELADKGGALRRAERKRAFGETGRTLEKIRGEIDEAIVASERTGTRKSIVFKSVLGKLETPFTSLSQVVSFLEELLTI